MKYSYLNEFLFYFLSSGRAGEREADEDEELLEDREEYEEDEDLELRL